MSFSEYMTEKEKKARAFNREPDEIKALKTNNPREKSKKGKVDDFFGKSAHKKAKFSVKKKAGRSNSDKAIGRRKRKSGKTRNARQILNQKHGINRAIDKDENKKYYLDHLQIADMMKKFGYDWEQEDGSWNNTEPRKAAFKAKNKRKKEVVPGTDGRKKISDFGKDEDIENVAIVPKPDTDQDDFEFEIDGKKVPEEDLTDFTAIGAGGIEYDITEEDLMEYEARLILGLIHGGRSAMHFEEVEETEEQSDIDAGDATVITVDPIIPTDKVLDKIEQLGYTYFPQLDEWRLDGEFPFQEDADGEDKKSVLARTYLAALGHFEVFDFDEEDNPSSLSKERVLQLMGDYGFEWNPESSTWNKQQLEPDEIQ